MSEVQKALLWNSANL